MAGVINRTARQFNLKVVDKDGRRITVRVAPGFSTVKDEYWDICKADPYVKELKKNKSLDYGKVVDDQELERENDTETKVKVTEPPKN